MLRGACFALALLLLAMSFASGRGRAKGHAGKPLSPGRRVRLHRRNARGRSPRRERDEEEFTAVPMEMRLDNYLPPAYFAGRYRQGFKFDGTEAGAQVTMVNGGEAEIVPQGRLLADAGDGRRRAGHGLSAHGRAAARQLRRDAAARRGKDALQAL